MNKNETLTTYTKNFDGWNNLAKQLDKIKSPLFNKKLKKYLFHPREIWYCSLGVNIGVEICGKHTMFERPVLIIKKSGRQFICLPLTSQKPKNEAFYFDISFIDPERKNKVESYVIITSLLTLDVNRLQRKIRKLNPADFEEIVKKSKEYFTKI